MRVQQVAGAIGVVAGGIALVGAPALADGQAPGGNNGTIKIERTEGGDQSKANEPHVACGVTVELWGYDAGTQTADLSFAAHAPTKGGEVLADTITWTTAERQGGRVRDAVYVASRLADRFAAAGIDPAEQGYHVKLTVNVTGSQGSDVKHKVFWLEPCEATGGATGSTTSTTTKGGGPSTTATTSTPSTTATSTTSTTTGSTATTLGGGVGGTTGSTLPGSTSTTVGGGAGDATGTTTGTGVGSTTGGTTLTSGSVLGATTVATQPSATVLGAVYERGTEAARGALPRTGGDLLGLATTGAGLVAGGTALTTLGRRRRRA